MDDKKLMLRVADYIIFATMLIASASIGIFFQITSKKKTNKDFLFAGKDMSILPVAFSLMATFMSATNLMGLPAEMYLYGTNMAFMNIGFILGPIITSYIFLPIFFNNNISTTYEFLEKRFGKTTRRLTSALFAIYTIFFTSATLYAPALALSAVTDLSIWMSVISVGVVCTFYCTLGGMKAVLWADVFQGVLMFVCLFAVIVQGSLQIGGIGNVFEIANEGGRLVIPKFSFNLETHYTMVNIFAQGMIIMMAAYGGDQCQVQRIMTLRNVKRSRIATYISATMIVSFQLLCCMCGLVLYAYFRNCDPMSSLGKPIQSADQLMPYFISTTLGHLPGIPGLCICGIFSASLSTVSSAINSLASVTTEDFMRPLFPEFNITVFHTKVISLFYGIICVALSFIIASLGNLIKMSIIICGNMSGPNLAIFLLAACTKTANERGVIVGFVTSIVLASYLSFMPGSSKTDTSLPLSNECAALEQNYTSSAFSFSDLQNPTSFIHPNATLSSGIGIKSDEVNSFHISYMWVSSLATITCLIVGYVGSLVIAFCSGDSENVPDIYLSPVRVWFSKKKIKNKFINNEADKERTEMKIVASNGKPRKEED